MNKLTIALLCTLFLAAAAFYISRSPMKQTSQTPTNDTNNITRTPSGLGYTVINAPQDNAQQPQAGQTVVVHYTGWLDDEGNPGAQFDSSVDRGTPFEFPVGMGYVIAGWDEALAAMKIGEKRRIYIPSVLGYGARGAGAVIPAHANLIFDVELLDVK